MSRRVNTVIGRRAFLASATVAGLPASAQVIGRRVYHGVSAPIEVGRGSRGRLSLFSYGREGERATLMWVDATTGESIAVSPVFQLGSQRGVSYEVIFPTSQQGRGKLNLAGEETWEVVGMLIVDGGEGKLKASAQVESAGDSNWGKKYYLIEIEVYVP